MTVTVSAYLELMRGMVRDGVSALTSQDYTGALGHAVARYSAHRPRVLVADVDAADDGVVASDVEDLADWDAETSSVRTVEYPLDEVPPEHIEHTLYRTPDAVLLRAPDVVSGETARVTYTAPHTVDATDTSTPTSDREAVASWAAARLLEELAARSADVTDSSISADGVDHQDQTRRYQGLATGYRNRFYELLGIDRKGEMRTPGASATVQLASRRLSTGNRRITHFRPGEHYGT